MTFGDLVGDQQVSKVPESVMQDLLSMEDERMTSECRVPPIYNNNCNYLPQSIMQYTDNGFTQTQHCGDYQTLGDMEDITLNYHVNGPLKSLREPEYVSMDYANIPVSVANCSTTIKQEPKEYSQTCCGQKKDVSYNTNDHKVSFTELDQLLNCDLTFYDDMNFGVQSYKEEVVVKEEYDSDPESCHSQDSDQESGLGENFDIVQSEVIRQVKKDIEYACTVLDIPAGELMLNQLYFHLVTRTSERHKAPCVVDFLHYHLRGTHHAIFTLSSDGHNLGLNTMFLQHDLCN